MTKMPEKIFKYKHFTAVSPHKQEFVLKDFPDFMQDESDATPYIMGDIHEARVKELLESNNALLERARRAETIPEGYVLVPIGVSPDLELLNALIRETCADSTRFIRCKIIDYSKYPAAGAEHLENLCILINRQRNELKKYAAMLAAAAQKGGE